MVDFKINIHYNVISAQVVELVDTPVLEAGVERRESSSLSLGTK